MQRVDIFEDALALNIPGPTIVLLVRSSVAIEVGGFDECLTRFNDTDFILRISQKYKVALIPEVVARAYVSLGMSRWDTIHHRICPPR